MSEALFDEFGGRDLAVLALPRGGIPVGLEVSKKLGADFGILEVKKIGAPDNPELAIGATGSRGEPFLDLETIKSLGVSEQYLKMETARKRQEASEREKFYSGLTKPVDMAGKVGILVDDGLATGATAQAAAKILEKSGLLRKVLAIPVAPPSSIEKVRESFDEVIALFQTWDFVAVGQFYENFSPLSDLEIKEMIKKYR